MTTAEIILWFLVAPPFGIAFIYFAAKAGRIGWLRANQMFFREEFKRTLEKGNDDGDKPR